MMFANWNFDSINHYYHIETQFPSTKENHNALFIFIPFFLISIFLYFNKSCKIGHNVYFKTTSDRCTIVQIYSLKLSKKIKKRDIFIEKEVKEKKKGNE